MIKFIKKNYIFLFSSFIIIYFLFNLLSGQRGLISYVKKKGELNNIYKKEKNLIENINIQEKKNKLLTDNLDLDFIETLIRDKFLFGKKNEKIYIIEEYEN